MTARTMVMGLGNLLMGDEGVGVRVVRRLGEKLCDPETDIVDGGTGGLHLLEYFLDHDRVVLVDAVMDGGAPGSISVSKPVYGRDYPPTLVAHDIGLKDVLDAVILMDRKPETWLVTITVAAVDAPSLLLSPAVEAAVEPAVVRILEVLAAARAR
ncbi:MAG TPA: hydrogenase maturation protease [Acidobacteriota bacterium]|nr:hydrogenase maturation protease [Acidobacteriota bacterium]